MIEERIPTTDIQHAIIENPMKFLIRKQNQEQV